MKLSYISKTEGTGGAIKQQPEDFIVQEIDNEGRCYRINCSQMRDGATGKFVHFVLQKRDWSTNDAMRVISKKLRMSAKRFNFAGTKDKMSVSTQLCSGFAVKREDVLAVRMKDIWINGAWYANDKVRLGQLLGNRFEITVRGQSVDAKEKVAKIQKELDGKTTNYFGEQRFGSTRRNTHKIGEKILQEDMEAAVRLYLLDSEGENNEKAKQARKQLEEHGDYAAALREFPKHLRFERTLLEHLAKNQRDHAGALRKLPRTLLLMFIHAYQSDIFNQSLSERIGEGKLEKEEGEYFCDETFGFPDIEKKREDGWLVGKLIGYETRLNEREKALLEKAGIAQSAFKLPHMPEIHSKGTYRTLMAPLKDFSFNESKFAFDLPSGSYATVALREFMDEEKS